MNKTLKSILKQKHITCPSIDYMEGHKLHEMWNKHLVPNAGYFKYLAKTEVALQTMAFKEGNETIRLEEEKDNFGCNIIKGVG